MPNIDPKQVIDDAATVAKAAAAQPDPKSFYKSKRFWISAVAVGLHYAGYLPPQYATLVALAANVLMPMLDKAVAK